MTVHISMWWLSEILPFQVHEQDGRNLPDLQLLGGISVGFAVSAEHFIYVRQPLLFREQLQAFLQDVKKRKLREKHPIHTYVYVWSICEGMWVCGRTSCLTCREHLLGEARGRERYIKASKVRDLR